jgi:ribonuclease HII
MNGMQRAVNNLRPAPARALIDGNRAPELTCAVETIIGGDHLVASISAASILAKVSRDQHMQMLHLQYPGYGFDRHKGYPTALHLEQLQALGPCPVHRRSFAPVKKAEHRINPQIA